MQDGVITDITRVDDDVEPAEPSVMSLRLNRSRLSSTTCRRRLMTSRHRCKRMRRLPPEGSQPTEEQRDILTIIAKAGGKKWLDKVTSMKSTFTPKNRQFVAHKTPGQVMAERPRPSDDP